MAEQRTVREIHKEAMDIMMDAMVDYHTVGWSYDLRDRVTKAYVLEKEAANKIELAPTNEPTRSILYRSAACLGLMAGLGYDAIEIAQEGLRGNPRASDREILKQIVNKTLDKSKIWEI